MFSTNDQYTGTIVYVKVKLTSEVMFFGEMLLQTLTKQH